MDIAAIRGKLGKATANASWRMRWLVAYILCMPLPRRQSRRNYYYQN